MNGVMRMMMGAANASEPYAPIEFVVGNGGSNGRSISLSGVSPGDFLLYVVADGDAMPPEVIPEWMDEIFVTPNNNGRMRIGAGWYPNDGPANFPSFPRGPGESGHGFMAFRNVHKGSPLSNYVITSASNSSRPNPPENDLLHSGAVIAFGAQRFFGGVFSSAPPEYQFGCSYYSSTGNFLGTMSGMGIYRLEETPGAYDPGGYSGNSSSGSSWAATIMLRATGT